ncbi:MAG TPA: hypothetical protein PKH65_07445 [Bacteroidia bacterium]|nr:hypothetical protein [Bacteroidia bacterium]HNT80503.1 hypothetical protein [Bacteroidia bacterium]
MKQSIFICFILACCFLSIPTQAQEHRHHLILQSEIDFSDKTRDGVINAVFDFEFVKEVKYCVEQNVIWVQYLDNDNQSEGIIITKLKNLGVDFIVKEFSQVEQLVQICSNEKTYYPIQTKSSHTQ